MMRKYLMIALALGCVSATGASAMSLNEAFRLGHICERPDGSIKQISGGDEVATLVAETNELRTVEYGKIAESTKAPMKAVRQQMGQKLQAKNRACK